MKNEKPILLDGLLLSKEIEAELKKRVENIFKSVIIRPFLPPF